MELPLFHHLLISHGCQKVVLCLALHDIPVHFLVPIRLISYAQAIYSGWLQWFTDIFDEFPHSPQQRITGTIMEHHASSLMEHINPRLNSHLCSQLKFSVLSYEQKNTKKKEFQFPRTPMAPKGQD